MEPQSFVSHTLELCHSLTHSLTLHSTLSLQDVVSGANYVLVSNGKGCGTTDMKLHVNDYAANNASLCAQGVKDMPECSSTFFYSPAYGWCKCQAAAGECSLNDSTN